MMKNRKHWTDDRTKSCTYMLVVGTLYFMLIWTMVGCGRLSSEKNENLECICLPVPDDYEVELSFLAHNEIDPIENFPSLNDEFIKVFFKQSIEVSIDYAGIDFSHIPSYIYEVCFYHLGEASYYYSRRLPKKNDNGLLCVRRIDGPVVYLDSHDVTITEIPCDLVEGQKEIVEQKRVEEKLWYSQKKLCPKHN